MAVIGPRRSTTAAELVASAEHLAGALAARGATRVGVSVGDAADVAALLGAASLAGVEVCQYPPAGGAEAAAELAARFDHATIVTDRAELAGLPGALTVADLLAGPADPAPAEPPAPRPHLVLTTGTTGAPRAARHDWDRVVRSVARVGPAPGQRWLLCFGLHQFAGLQVLVHVAAAGATLVTTPSLQPRDGLEAMRAHGVTHVSATPTWWRFLLAELRADGGPAPALEQLTLGGEAASGPLLDELAAAFPGARTSHVYAATEVGSTGSVRDGRSGLDASILERGDDADIAMRVVDGELWVRSRVGMLGYYGEEPVDPDGWRPTGDLVDVVDGRIEFRGRTSEVINVGGTKVHPLPIEELVEQVPGVLVARAFGRPNALTGAIVAVEAIPAPGSDEAALKSAIRTACASLPSAAQPRSIKFVDQLDTLGGKRLRRGDDDG